MVITVSIVVLLSVCTLIFAYTLTVASIVVLLPACILIVAYIAVLKGDDGTRVGNLREDLAFFLYGSLSSRLLAMAPKTLCAYMYIFHNK